MKLNLVAISYGLQRDGYRHRLRSVCSVALLTISLAACSAATEAPNPSDESARTGRPDTNVASETGRRYDKVGNASWYGGKFHGRRTASGQRFDMHAMTAAHRSLPFGSRVKVTNLDNGKSAVVTINDRGPFVDNRIIDVSRRAADVLGFVRQGIARVRVQVLAVTRSANARAK